MGSGRRNGTVVAGQGQAPGGAELSEHAHREIGLWLAATPPEQRNLQRFLAEVARTHGLAARRGDPGWDVQAAERAFGRVTAQEWWRRLEPEALRAAEQVKGYPLLQAALQRQGYGQGPRPAPRHSMSQVMSAQQVGPVEGAGPRTTTAERAAQEAHLQRVSQSGGWGDGADAGNQGKAPLTAEEWLHTQMTMDSARNGLMEPAQRDRYLRSSLSYWEQRPSHPEWAAFDPAPRSAGAGRAELPPGQNWFSWQVHGRPDLSPLPARAPSPPVIPVPDLLRAFPDASPKRGPKPEPGHPWPATVDSQWEKENIVEVPNRWGILSPYRRTVVRDGKTVSVPVLATIRCHRLVAPHLVAALDELDSRGLLYLIKTVDTFFPKYKSSGKEASSHLFGFGLDFNQADLPALTRDQVNQRKKQGQSPAGLDDRVVAVFQKHGFSYGGDWNSPYDPMHIEYSDREALGLE
jgi:hypothetical protein